MNTRGRIQATILFIAILILAAQSTVSAACPGCPVPTKTVQPSTTHTETPIPSLTATETVIPSLTATASPDPTATETVVPSLTATATVSDNPIGETPQPKATVTALPETGIFDGDIGFNGLVLLGLAFAGLALIARAIRTEVNRVRRN